MKNMVLFWNSPPPLACSIHSIVVAILIFLPFQHVQITASNQPFLPAKMPTTSFQLFTALRHQHFLPIFLLLFTMSTIYRLNAQEDPDNPDTPEFFTSEHDDGMPHSIRAKRQWGCPNGCFSPCTSFPPANSGAQMAGGEKGTKDFKKGT